VIDLVYYDDKTVEEVTEITGAPKNTVKTRMLYARKCLGKLLTSAGYVDEWIALVFPTRRVPGGWIDAETRKWVEVHPTHWRSWITQPGSASSSATGRKA